MCVESHDARRAERQGTAGDDGVERLRRRRWKAACVGGQAGGYRRGVAKVQRLSWPVAACAVEGEDTRQGSTASIYGWKVTPII